MLYFVSSPIGNLSDITLRALEVLRESEIIFCEDTRHSQKLLQHYQIQRPLDSYHHFNEEEKIQKISALLEAEKSVSLLCDAGTPMIADPGKRLLKHCLQRGLPYTAIPGPCALIQALSLSSFSSQPMQFLGFLPKKAEALRQTLLQTLFYPGTSIVYESPKRLSGTLELLVQHAPTQRIAVARELTKTFEEIKEGEAKDLMQHFQKKPCKGEVVVLFEGLQKLPASWEHLSEKEHVKELMSSYDLCLKEAIRLAAQLRFVSKRSIYQNYHL